MIDTSWKSELPRRVFHWLPLSPFLFSVNHKSGQPVMIMSWACNCIVLYIVYSWDTPSGNQTWLQTPPIIDDFPMKSSSFCPGMFPSSHDDRRAEGPKAYASDFLVLPAWLTSSFHVTEIHGFPHQDFLLVEWSRSRTWRSSETSGWVFWHWFMVDDFLIGRIKGNPILISTGLVQGIFFL